MVIKTVNRLSHAVLESKSLVLTRQMREGQTQTTAVMPEKSRARPPVKLETSDTGIQLNADELFDFDREVESILERLVGTSIDKAARELIHERDLNAIRCEHRLYCDKRDHEKAQLDQLQRLELNKKDEMRNRLQQERVRLEMSQAVMKKTVSLKLSKDVIEGMLESSIEDMASENESRFPILLEIQQDFIPSVLTCALERYSTEPSWLLRHIEEKFVPSVIRLVTSFNNNLM